MQSRMSTVYQRNIRVITDPKEPEISPDSMTTMPVALLLLYMLHQTTHSGVGTMGCRWKYGVKSRDVDTIKCVGCWGWEVILC